MASGNELPLAVLPHAAYYAALAGLDGHQDSPAWQATVAGLVVLRLVERWIACSDKGTSDIQGNVPAISADDLTPRALRELVAAVRTATAAVQPTDMKRQPLHRLAEAAGKGSPVEIVRALLVYAYVLHAEGSWPLAADVYETVYRLVTAPHCPDARFLYVLGPVALERLGHSKRMMGDLENAATVYRQARVAATAHGDAIRDLRIRLSEANLLIHRGNLPGAIAALEAIIRAASQAPEKLSCSREIAQSLKLDLPFLDIDIDARDITALARHARGLVATMIGDHAFALEQCFAAWKGYRDPARRERVWLDMAVALSNMGVRDAAQSAYALLRLTAREREIQLIAALNLMEIAVMDGQANLAAAYRREVEGAAASGALPAAIAPWLAFHSAKAEARLGQPDRARHMFRKALELAERAHVNEVIIRTDAALIALATGKEVEPLPRTPPAVPTFVQGIARTICDVRRG